MLYLLVSFQRQAAYALFGPKRRNLPWNQSRNSAGVSKGLDSTDRATAPLPATTIFLSSFLGIPPSKRNLDAACTANNRVYTQQHLATDS
jgi:hypothetical protein